MVYSLHAHTDPGYLEWKTGWASWSCGQADTAAKRFVYGNVDNQSPHSFVQACYMCHFSAFTRVLFHWSLFIRVQWIINLYKFQISATAFPEIMMTQNTYIHYGASFFYLMEKKYGLIYIGWHIGHMMNHFMYRIKYHNMLSIRLIGPLRGAPQRDINAKRFALWLFFGLWNFAKGNLPLACCAHQ